MLALSQGNKKRSKRQRPFKSLRWPIYVLNSVVDTKLPAILFHRRSTTVSLETHPLYSFVYQTVFLSSHPNNWLDLAKDKMGNSIIKLRPPYDMSDKANLHISKKWSNAAECFTCFSRATIRPSAFSSFSKSSSRSMSDIGSFCKQTIQLDFCAMQVS